WQCCDDPLNLGSFWRSECRKHRANKHDHVQCAPRLRLTQMSFQAGTLSPEVCKPSASPSQVRILDLPSPAGILLSWEDPAMGRSCCMRLHATPGARMRLAVPIRAQVWRARLLI